jgi:hypothetical protein
MIGIIPIKYGGIIDGLSDVCSIIGVFAVSRSVDDVESVEALVILQSPVRDNVT